MLRHCWTLSPWQVCKQGLYSELNSSSSFSFLQNQPWGPAYPFPPILLNFLRGLSGSSLECSVGIADSSACLWAIWFIFVSYLWYTVSSITALPPFPSPLWTTGHLLPYLDYSVNNKLEPGAELISPDKITEAWLRYEANVSTLEEICYFIFP